MRGKAELEVEGAEERRAGLRSDCGKKVPLAGLDSDVEMG